MGVLTTYNNTTSLSRGQKGDAPAEKNCPLAAGSDPNICISYGKVSNSYQPVHPYPADQGGQKDQGILAGRADLKGTESKLSIFYIIRNGNPFCAFPAHLHLQIHMPTSSYLAASAKSAVTLFRQIVTLSREPCRYRTNVYGPFGKPWDHEITRSRES